MSGGDGRSSRYDSSIWTNSPYTEHISDTSDDEEVANNADDLDQALDFIGLVSTELDRNHGDLPVFTSSENESSDVFERQKVDVYKQLHENSLPPVISSVSPSGHFAEFNAETNNEEVDFGEDLSVWSDTNTMLGRAAALLKMDDVNSFMNKRIQQQAKLGAKQLDKITTVPLSAFWHAFTQVAAILVFLTNVGVALADIFMKDEEGNYTNLHYKVPNFLMGVAENIALVVWFIFQPKGDSANETTTKYQQYSENVLHEVLLYPLIVLSVFGFANDKMYQMPGDFYGWLQIVLLTIDIFDMVWTQIMRMFMIYTFVNDVRGFLGSDVNIGGNVLGRALFTTVANFVVFMFVILLLGAQVHDDNYTSGDYHATSRSGFLMIAVMTLPLFNLFMFVVVNVQWLVELLLLLGSRGQTEDADSLKKTELGDMTTAVAQRAHASDEIKKRLDGMRSVHPFKKLISVVVEPKIAALIFVWEIIVFLAIFYFDGCHNISICQGYVVQSLFAAIAIVTNSHLVVVTFFFNVIVTCVMAAMLVYPFSIPLFLR